jgi:Na+-transporting NADH:ubiquinone oxidoreductase subunit A
VAYDPREFPGIVPRLAVKPGEKVKQGSALFYSKANPAMRFLSPASGTVKEVYRGKRRVITAVVVDVEGDEKESFPVWSAQDVAAKSRDEVSSALMAGGLWACLRTRPLNMLADPTVTPQAILVCGTETGPLQPGADVLLSSDERDALQLGLTALGRLTEGRVHLTVPGGSAFAAFEGLTGVETHQFSGPHPSGDATVQINHVEPPTGSNQVWYISAWDAARIGKLLSEGVFPNERIYAAVGAGCETPRIVKTLLGAPILEVIGAATSGEHRYIRGSVLTGTTTAADQWCGFYASAIHVLPAEVPRTLFGWAMPRLGTWSAHRAYLSGFIGSSKGQDMRPGVYGGFRGLVPVGAYSRVVATPDVYPEFLMRSLVAGDLAESINLGLLDLSDEEAALCTYICPSKVEMDVLLKQGLELYIQEA